MPLPRRQSGDTATVIVERATLVTIIRLLRGLAEQMEMGLPIESSQEPSAVNPRSGSDGTPVAGPVHLP